MTFFDRYAGLAEKNRLEPCSQRAAELFGVTKATISTWGSRGTTPKGDTVARIADELHVSADYLLGRTDDPTDYAKGATPADAVAEVPETTQKTVSFPGPEKPGAEKRCADSIILTLYARLDAMDRMKIQGVLQGMLMQDKYMGAPALNAAHVRTDAPVTDEMVAHDEEIMDGDDF